MTEAGVALSAVGVEDPQRRPPPGWAGAIARDDHLRSLADDVPPEADPRSTGKLEPDAGRFADRGLEITGSLRPFGSRPRGWLRRRLEDDERDPGPPGERREPSESIAESRSRDARASAGRQVDDEQVHRPTGEQRAGDGHALLGIGGRQDDEPLQLDTASHGLHRVQRRREIQPGHDRARGLGLRNEPQGQRRPAARDVASNRQAHPARHATGTEDRIELGEAGRMDPVEVNRGAGRHLLLGIRILERHRRQRADDLTREPLPGEPGRGRPPARSKRRERRGELGGRSAHGGSIEHLFE